MPCDKTAVISSEYHCSFSSRNSFRDNYRYFMQPPPHWLLVWYRIISESTIYLYELRNDRLKLFEPILGCGHQLDIQCQKYRH